MIVAPYARVSTSDQSCEMQLRELRQYAERQSLQVFAKYVDTGFSGAARNWTASFMTLGSIASTPCWFGSWTAGAVAWRIAFDRSRIW